MQKNQIDKLQIKSLTQTVEMIKDMMQSSHPHTHSWENKRLTDANCGLLLRTKSKIEKMIGITATTREIMKNDF